MSIEEFLQWRLSDRQYIRFSEWRCRWFPYRMSLWTSEAGIGPAFWQWPDILGMAVREPSVRSGDKRDG